MFDMAFFLNIAVSLSLSTKEFSSSSDSTNNKHDTMYYLKKMLLAKSFIAIGEIEKIFAEIR